MTPDILTTYLVVTARSLFDTSTPLVESLDQARTRLARLDPAWQVPAQRAILRFAHDVAAVATAMAADGADPADITVSIDQAITAAVPLIAAQILETIAAEQLRVLPE
jgi:hypothetical protein